MITPYDSRVDDVWFDLVEYTSHIWKVAEQGEYNGNAESSHKKHNTNSILALGFICKACILRLTHIERVLFPALQKVPKYSSEHPTKLEAQERYHSASPSYCTFSSAPLSPGESPHQNSILEARLCLQLFALQSTSQVPRLGCRIARKLSSHSKPEL